MPSILGEWFNVEMAARTVGIVAFIVAGVVGLAMLVGRRLAKVKRQQREIDRWKATPREAPSHDALKKFCHKWLEHVAWQGLTGNSATAMAARDEARYWHALIDILDGRLVVQPDMGRIEPRRRIGETGHKEPTDGTAD